MNCNVFSSTRAVDNNVLLTKTKEVFIGLSLEYHDFKRRVFLNMQLVYTANIV